MIKKFFVTLAFLSVLAASYCNGKDQTGYRVVNLRSGAVISFAEMLEDLQKADFIFIGESHDKVEHHRLQLQVIKGLHAAGIPLAVGFEMFRAASQPVLNRWSTGQMDTEDFIRFYYDDWGLPWPMYSDILLYLRQENIPLVGLNIPRSISRKVAKLGSSSLTGEELAQLPPGLSCDVSPAYRQYIRDVFSGHAGKEEQAFQNFCEAQVLWDKAMAWHLVQYRGKNPGISTVVLSGMVHALKRGIPFRVEEMEKKYISRVIVPREPGIDPRSINPSIADYLVIAD